MLEIKFDNNPEKFLKNIVVVKIDHREKVY